MLFALQPVVLVFLDYLFHMSLEGVSVIVISYTLSNVGDSILYCD